MKGQGQRSREPRVRVGVTYGMGGRIGAEFSRDEVAGKSAAELIAEVIRRPQESEAAVRTARVVEEAMRTAREIDAELIRSSRNRADGEPISLDQVVLAREGSAEEREGAVVQEIEEVNLRVSESYRGGGARCRRRRFAEEA